jgi:hypothetical protein
MSTKIKENVWLLLLIAVIALSAVGFAASRMISRHTAATEKSDTRQNRPNVNRGRDKGYVNRARLSPRLAMHLHALGDRLEKPGTERLTITGELRSDSQTREIAATLEFPDKLRLGIQNRLITFDEQEAKAAQTPVTDDELDLIESLSYDSAEHFFSAQMQGNATRFLGSRFRTDDGSNSAYSGPYFDIYKIADRIDASGQERAAKLYYFNSETLLLERVTYVINRNGSEVNVETKLSDWRDENGQKTARRIERLENGQSVFVLNIRSAQFGRRTDDGMFRQ